jgi:hypothetical protein
VGASVVRDAVHWDGRYAVLFQEAVHDCRQSASADAPVVLVAWLELEPIRSRRVLRQQAACRAHPAEADELSAALLAAGGRAAGPALAVGPQAEQAAVPRQALWARVSQS